MFAARNGLFTDAPTAGVTPVQPDELAWDLTAESALGTIDHGSGVAVDTGQMVNTINIGSNGSVGPSSLDSLNVYNNSPSGASYLCTVSAMPERVVYMCGEYRFNGTGASNTDCQMAIIVWNSRVISGDLSCCHLVHNFDADEVFVQKVTDGAATFTTIGGPWSVPHPTSGQLQTIEYAIDPVTPGMVVRLPDNSIESFTDASLASMTPLYPCWEPFYNGAYNANKWDPEVLTMKASTVAGMSAAQLAYTNDLLDAGGYGPL